jgi:serine/threonine protein kinase/WD40 repeat protein
MARLLDPAPVEESSDSEDYEVLRQLAKGGMGAVMEARDLTLHRTVAMKVMHSQGNRASRARERFDREARVLARLEHPNIVPIHAMGRDADGRPFYTMKLVRGETLQRILDQLRHGDPQTVKTYSLAELLGVFKKVCHAVAFAHSRGVIHRDLKPENIMVGEFGEVLVMDWGLAKVAGEGTETAGEAAAGFSELSDRDLQDLTGPLTLDGVVMGTPQFMSPEQASGCTADLDARADIFSLGAILYAILTLRPPVGGSSVGKVLAKVRSGELDPPSSYNTATHKPAGRKVSPDESSVRLQKTRGLPHCPNGHVPEALSAVTMRAMALKPDERYRDVAGLLADIDAFLGGFATSVENVGALGQLWLLMNRHRVVSALLGVMLVLTAGFIVKVIASEGKARRSADLATQEAGNARQAESRAINEATNARAAEAVAQQQKEAARKALAESRIALADAALRDRDVVQMRRHLEAVAPEHRNDDWRYLSRTLQPSLGAIAGTNERFFDDVQAVPGSSGEFVASDRLGNVLVVEAASRSIVRTIPTGLEIPTGSVGAMRIAVSADASLVAAAIFNGKRYRVFDYRTGELRYEIPTAGGRVFSLCFSGPANDKLFVVERTPQAGRMVQLTDGKTLWSTPMNAEVAIDPSGSLIAAHYMNAAQDVRLIDATDGRTLRTMDAEGERSFIWRLDFSPDGKTLAAGDHLGDVHLWEAATGRLLRRFNTGAGRLQGLAFGPGDSLITMCEEAREDSVAQRSLRVWNSRNTAELASFIGIGLHEAWFAFDPKAGLLMTRGPELKFYRVPLGRELAVIPARSDGRYAQFMGEEHLFAGTQKSFVGTYALSASAPPREVWSAPDNPYPFAVAGNGRSALATSSDLRALGTYHLQLDAADKLTAPLESRLSFAVEALDLNHDGTTALLAGKNGQVQLYDLGRHETRELFRRPVTNGVKRVRFCQNDQQAAILSQVVRETGHATDILALWDLSRRQMIAAVTNHFVCHSFDLDREQKRIALVGADLMVRIYEASTLRLEQQFRAHNKSINAVAFHPVLPVVATASDDMSVKLWDARTGEMLDYFIGPARPPLSLSFSPSGKLLAAGCADKTTRVWPVGELLPAKTAAK